MSEEINTLTTDEPSAFEAEYDPTEAFLRSAGVEPKSAEDEEKDDAERDREKDPDEEPPLPSDKPEDKPEDKPYDTPSEDDPEFDLKVGEETRKVKLSDLRRVYGQESDLARQTVELADSRAKVEVDTARAVTSLTVQTERAQKAWEPYSKLDFLVLSTQMIPADFAQLRVEAQAALANVNFFSAELDGLQKATNERLSSASHATAQATIATLNDPVKGIKGWSPAMYAEVMDYAQSLGMTDARKIVDVAPIRMIHKAMMADRGETKVLDVKKVVAKATVVLKPGATKAAVVDKGDRYLNSLRDMSKSGGGQDATADAFLAMARRER